MVVLGGVVVVVVEEVIMVPAAARLMEGTAHQIEGIHITVHQGQEGHVEQGQD